MDDAGQILHYPPNVETVPVYLDPYGEYANSVPIEILTELCPKMLNYLDGPAKDHKSGPKIASQKPDIMRKSVKGEFIRLNENIVTQYGVSYLLTWLVETAQKGKSNPIELHVGIVESIDIYQAFSFFGLHNECEEYGRYIDMAISYLYSQWKLSLEQVQAIWERRHLHGTTRFTNRLLSLLVDHTRNFSLLQDHLNKEKATWDITHPLVHLMMSITRYMMEERELNALVTAAYKRVYRPPPAFCPINRQVANSRFMEAPRGPTEELSPACWLGLCISCVESEASPSTDRSPDIATWSSKARIVWALCAELKDVKTELAKMPRQKSNVGICQIRTPETAESVVLMVEALPE